MNNAPDITFISLMQILALLIIPLGMTVLLRLKLRNTIVISTFRMFVQLFLIGIFLTWFFEFNQPLLTVSWFLVMVGFASFSFLGAIDVKKAKFMFISICSLFFSCLLIILYFTVFGIELTNIFEAKYVIAIGGMILGNSMRANIIGVNDLFKSLRRDEKRYIYGLAHGGSVFESAIPYIKKSLSAALKPHLATMATLGIVSLPGMMTGQLIGGSDPLVAIKYQIAIMIAIYAAMSLSLMVTIFLILKKGFNEYGMLKKDIFNQ